LSSTNHAGDSGDKIAVPIGAGKLVVQNGDLLDVEADALVCPVDPTMSFKSGLTHAVSITTGKQVRTERPLVPKPYGKVVILPGGKLKVKYIFLTVLLGQRGTENMRSAIRQSVNRTIRYAEFLRLKSIAFPVLGSPEHTPPYSFIAHEMLTHVRQYFQKRNTKLKAVLVSAYNTGAFEAFKSEAREIADL
jgi:O-acetyl-ADP-ribose deacetylase (regulator of RNase III)